MKLTLRLAVLVVPVLLFSADVHATPLKITLDTSSLSGTQTLVFGLTNFDVNANTVFLSDFVFGGGAVVGSADCTLGGIFSGSGCSGDLASGVTLEDLDPTAAFFSQQFQAGATVSFELNATANFIGPVPDQFSMFLCDMTLTTCYSDDASGALLLLDLVNTISPASFALFEASFQDLPEPVVSVAAPVPVPEPGTLWMLAAGIAAAAGRRRRSRPVTGNG